MNTEMESAEISEKPSMKNVLSGDISRSKTVLFPKPTSTDYLILKPTIVKPLTQLTVCLSSYTDLNRVHSLFSLATRAKDNALLIYPMPPNNISISINNEDIYFTVDPEVLDWKHTCVTWDSETGLLQLWINGKRYPRRVTRTRSPISPPMIVILGQEQDNFGGGFEASQSFVGEIRDVNLWDYVLSPTKITEYLYFNYNINANIIGWKNDPYEKKGNTMVLEN
ncbi:jeltraxin-like [Leptodactylus fuscus]|uniref:jeltraxin-like n=1 Tax=Leptodactylus fuscus TaxID=238119 RepID=UPI003F4F15B2